MKKIEIQGFKSFANKTEIKFKNDITAIVGPNGSGKSNISDAIRWVLGEQSVKNLRGNKMEDVIFSGTDKRRALGFAEVSIYFNNEDNAIPIDYSEVVVTRRVFRSGESEYYINKNACRLKDVRTMFMDTGIGKDGYSIIGQGRIDEILSNKPEDRRNIFEEASEIVKYKSKKEEAEKRLEKTETNLNRIKDLIHEISSQEKTLKTDSQKANDFVVLYEELKTLEINLHRSQILNLKEKIEENSMYLQQIENELCDIEKEESDLRSNCEDMKEKIIEKEKSIENLRDEEINTIKGLEGAKNQKSLLNEKDNFSRLELSRLEEEKEKIKRKQIQLNQELDNVNNEKLDTMSEYDVFNINYKFDKEILELLHKGILQLEADLETKNKEFTQIQNKEYEFKTKLEGLDSLNKNSNEKISKLKSNIDDVLNNLKAESSKLEDTKEDGKVLEEELKRYKNHKDKLFNQKNTTLQHFTGLEKEINNLQMKYEGNLSKYNLYKSMEDSYEGYYKGVKELLKEIDKSKELKVGYIGIVADLFKVKKELETAIDISLGGSLQNFVVENETDGKRMIDYLKENKLGRVTFLPINAIKPNHLNVNLKDDIGVLGLAHELLDYDSKYKAIFENLLGRTIIVNNLNNGIRLANKYNHRYKIVTLEGDVLNPGGSLTGGSYKNNSLSIVSRKNRIEELKSSLREIEQFKNELFNKKNEKLETLTEIEKNIEDIEIEIIEKKEREIEINRITQSYENEINLGERELRKMEDELSLLLEDAKDFAVNKDKYILEKDNLNCELNILENEILIDSEFIKQKRYIKTAKEEELTGLKIEINKIENKIKNLEEDIVRKTDEYNSLNIDYQRIELEIENINSKINYANQDTLSIDDKIQELENKNISITDQLSECIKAKDEIKAQYELKYKKIEELNNNSNILEKKRDGIDLNLEKWKFKIENYKEKLYEDYEIEFTENLTIDLNDIDVKDSKERILYLKSKIKTLGNVNVAAIDEYKDVKERLEFLQEQHTDLINGKEDLEEIIKDMEKKMRVQFMKSFKIINENFSIIFSNLFNGGTASLELDSGEDVLQSGIQINVQPPGKKLQNLNLLSGGEKSLTAVALLFAILKSKPSPFCILDEIDAALDDANIARYTDFLKQFNEETQFILITHRKTTMEIANVLYGVTMEEDGISQLISIKLQDDIAGLAS